MENAMVAGPGGQAEGRSLGRIAVALVGVALVVAALLAFQRPAGAQIDVGALIRSIVCPILNALAAAIPFLRPILSAISAAFGCVISG